MVTEWYDAHIHFFYPHPNKEILAVLRDLEEKRLAGFDALAFGEIPSDLEMILTMVPKAYHENITPQVLEHQKDPFPVIKQAAPLKIIPFADARFVQKDAYQKVRGFKQRGFQGLKLLYVPEGEVELQIGGMEKAFGRPVKESENVTGLLIEGASSHGMPVLFHADLKKYGEFVEEMIRSHPDTNFNIPHFGSSRKAISALMETYPNCYTDLSSLIPAMERDPDAYRNFIIDYQDRILFGSDGVIGWPEHVASTLRCVRRFLEGGEVLEKLMNRNYLKFHQIPGGAQ